ncbi:hypothetical protein, partial [Streptomyces sp. wa1063]|uniref:hypothetical protein n=1 Tax=Streptomyces sp. wa1063 TaxID=1828212 RepID=UPI0015CF48E9
RDDTYTTILDAARDTDSNARDTALHMLAQRWPELEATWDCAAIRFEETPGAMRDDLVQILTLVWPEKSRTEKLLLKLAKVHPNNSVVNSSLSYLHSTAVE